MDSCDNYYLATWELDVEGATVCWLVLASCPRTRWRKSR